MITVLLLAHNEKEEAKLSLEALRAISGKIELSVVLVDHASTDGLQEWAMQQSDITYIGTEDGIEPWGSVLKQVVEVLEIDTDIVIMQSRYVVYSEVLEQMFFCLHQNDRIGVVGCMSNDSTFPSQRLYGNFSGSDNMVQRVNENKKQIYEKAMGFDCGMFMIKASAFRETGGFDDRFFLLKTLSQDIAISMIKKGYDIFICKNAAVYSSHARYHESFDTYKKYERGDKRQLEEKWKMHYFNIIPNNMIIQLIDAPKDADIHVLEIGCDCGATLFEIKRLFPNAATYGCDIVPGAIDLAGYFVDEAFVANIEEKDLAERSPVIKEKSLDYIIFGDVLEHLRYPEEILKYVKQFLKPNGVVLACIPNLMNISVMKQILNGNFTYTETGLLDKTHIHLFTFHEIVRTFQNAGYVIAPDGISMTSSQLSEEDEALVEHLLRLGSGTERFMYQAFHFILSAHPGNTGT